MKEKKNKKKKRKRRRIENDVRSNVIETHTATKSVADQARPNIPLYK